MIARPKRSRFMGSVYAITFAEPDSIVVEGNEAWGATDHSAQTIQIENGLHHDKERGVVVHEILHQMLELSGSDLTEKVEEHVCTLLGGALIGHMRDNPTLWRYLLQRPPK